MSLFITQFGPEWKMLTLTMLLEAVPATPDQIAPAWLLATFTFLTPIMVALAAWISYKARGNTNARIQEIHVLANDRLTTSLAQIDRLQIEVGKLSESIRVKDEKIVFDNAVSEAVADKSQ